MSVTIRDADDNDSLAWDRFLSTNPGGSFYHLHGWRRIVREQFGHQTVFLLAQEADQIVGVLPLTLLSSRLFGRILCSVPFVNYGGPCAESESVSTSLVDEAISRSRKLGADYLELRCAEPLDTDLPVSRHKVSLTVSLDPDPDVLWTAFSSKHRKNVRRAYKNDLAVRAGGVELLPAFYTVLERSWRDLGTPLYRRDYFHAILSTFPRNTRLYVCEHAGQPVSVALVGFHDTTAEGMWQGGAPQARSLQANYVLYWEMIRDVCLRGCRLFHLGRSSADSGSEHFKSRWNAESRQLYWYFHRPFGGPMPALNVENPRFRLAIATWRRMPLWIVRRLGPSLARCIP